MKSGSNTGTTARAGIGCATNAHCFAHRAGEAVPTGGMIAQSESATREGTVMPKNKSFTGSRRSVGTPTLNKEQYFQLIKMIRNAKKEGEDNQRTSGKSQCKP